MALIEMDFANGGGINPEFKTYTTTANVEYTENINNGYIQIGAGTHIFDAYILEGVLTIITRNTSYLSNYSYSNGVLKFTCSISNEVVNIFIAD